jgi:hypothetical protein
LPGQSFGLNGAIGMTTKLEYFYSCSGHAGFSGFAVNGGGDEGRDNTPAEFMKWTRQRCAGFPADWHRLRRVF